ncbi:hypothetical protein AB0N97_39850 [Streptomyces collinus]
MTAVPYVTGQYLACGSDVPDLTAAARAHQLHAAWHRPIDGKRA